MNSFAPASTARRAGTVRGLALALGLLLPAATVRAAVAPPPLRTVAVPKPANLASFVRDEAAAVALGKAFFWDMQTGSDGIQACATCHFHAGADGRRKNQLDPGSAHGGTTFEVAGPNATLQDADFPFHRVANPDDRASAVLLDRDDVVSSQGVCLADFVDIVPGQAAERCTPVPDPVWHVGPTNVRRVAPRNAPTVIDAVFNFRNFLDGRASPLFNGVSPFGPRDAGARVVAVQPDGSAIPVAVAIPSASLASQAVGPPVNAKEMSCAGRTFPKLGKKLLALTPLAKQLVDPTDATLGTLANSALIAGTAGLRASYAQLIEQAFVPRWWSSSKVVTFPAGVPVVSDPTGAPLTTDEFTVMEANFSLFWGLAIQLYESRLIADDTPFDRFTAGNATALSAEQQVGLDLFLNGGQCFACHVSPTLSAATVNNLGKETPIQLMSMAQGTAFYDGGFYNIGVTPTAADAGVGGEGPGGTPLSFARRQQLGVASPEANGIQVLPFISAADRIAVAGAFKTPGLRNVALTAPYMHNGGMLTLAQVVDFYVRGGDFHAANIADLDPKVDGVVSLVGNPAGKAALVAFLESLTDDRVRFEEAPFDHPELFVPNGHPGDATAVVDDGTGQAVDELLQIPAVGAAGRTIGIDGTARPRCGDSLVNQPSEQCDGTADAACPGACRADCTCAVPPAPIAGVVEADVSVVQSSAGTRYGTKTILEADASSVRQTFLRVRVAGVGTRPVLGAVIRLQVASKSGAESNSGGRIHPISSCAWVESTMNWKTRPAIDGPVIGLPIGKVKRGDVVPFDVTAAIPGDGVYCFAIDTTSSDLVQYNSREAKSGQPEVTIMVPGSLPPAVVAACGDGVLQPGEECDGAADAACPGLCQSGCRCGVAPPPPPPPAAPLALDLAPAADTYIEAGAEATWDHGLSDHVDVDLSPFDVAYLRFDLRGVTTPILGATLTLHCTNSSVDGGTIYPVAGSSWIEGTGNGIDASSATGPGLKWFDVDTNRDGKVDALDASPLVPDFAHPAASLGAVTSGKAVTADVTAAFQPPILATGQPFRTLALTSRSSDGTTYSSANHPTAAWRPVLHLTLAAAP